MKIWNSFSGEHSAKLRIVGKFKTNEEANKAVACFNDLLNVPNKERGTNPYFSDGISKVLTKHNLHYFTENDPEQLDFFHKLEAYGNEIVVETDEVEVQALIKVMLSYGAKIELYSRHNYPMS